MNVLGIFVKQPVAGRVKTRLAADIGEEAATQMYAAFVEDVVARFRNCGDRRILCFDPDTEEALSDTARLAGSHYVVQPQDGDTLDARLHAFFESAFAAGGSRVVVIGSDSPTLPLRLVDQAFAELNSRNAVIGPCTDGGFYLLGLRPGGVPNLSNVDWSGPDVLRQTVADVRDAALSIALLDPWYDVDDATDLRMMQGHLAAMHGAELETDCPRTQSALEG